MIPHQSSVHGWKSQITQPPLLAWGVWENYQGFARPQRALEYALPILEGYLNWDLTHRDRNGNRLLEWWIEGNVRSALRRIGAGQLLRFDRAVPLDAVDFSAWAAADMGYLSRIAAELGQQEKAAEWGRARERDVGAVARVALGRGCGVLFRLRYGGESVAGRGGHRLYAAAA